LTFAEVRVVDDDWHACCVSEGSSGDGIEVVVSGDRRIRVGPGFDETTFLRIVALLEGQSPC
jgi:hypothetical protein